jgi:hypothetical protein
LSAYKNVDLDAELARMSLWLLSAKGLTRKGNINFITNWLSKSKQIPMSIESAALDDFFITYLQDLWKDLGHILEFNTLRK